MKKLLVLSCLFVLLIVNAVAIETVPLVIENPKPKDPQPLSITYNSASSTIDETELGIYFDWYVGYATISVYDSADNLVDVEVVDTDTTTEVFIPTTSYNSGEYKLKVSYGSTNLVGYFEIP